MGEHVYCNFVSKFYKTRFNTMKIICVLIVTLTFLALIHESDGSLWDELKAGIDEAKAIVEDKTEIAGKEVSESGLSNVVRAKLKALIELAKGGGKDAGNGNKGAEAKIVGKDEAENASN